MDVSQTWVYGTGVHAYLVMCTQPKRRAGTGSPVLHTCVRRRWRGPWKNLGYGRKIAVTTDIDVLWTLFSARSSWRTFPP